MPLLPKPLFLSPPTTRSGDGGRHDLGQLTRVLCHHDWIDVEEWVGSLHALADLDESAIDEVARRSKIRDGRLF